MEVTFGPNDGAVQAPPVPEIATPTAPTPPAAPQPEAMVVRETNTAVQQRKFILGDKLPSFRDVIMPRLNIVQAIGNLKDQFPQGALVFGQNTVLFTAPVIDPNGNVKSPATPPVNLTVVGIISDRFSERVEGGFGGLIVDSEDAVRSNGGTLDYKEWELKKSSGMRLFQQLTDLLVVIRRPEQVKDDDTVFNFLVDGHKYALAAWALKGAAYTSAMKRVLNYQRLAGVLKTGFPAWNFELVTRLEKFRGTGGKSAWIPILSQKAKNTEVFMNFVYEMAGTPTV
jgi:hypothetical protein